MKHNLSRLFYLHGDKKPVNRPEDIRFINNVDEFNNNIPEISDYKNYFAFDVNIKEFELTTIYPGLLLGAGYSHPALKDVKKNDRDEESDFQLGFFFDHTTGLPVIPGSSVKGVLKSVFPKTNFKYRGEKLEYIRDLTSKILIESSDQNKDSSFITEDNWEEIFFGSVKAKRKHIFYDAYVSKLPDKNRLFEEDYITPHTKGIFKNPIPIRFLKVGPGVTFTFQFRLFDYKDINGNVLISADDIKEIFRRILIDFGVGAKRNVGYGQFE